MKTLSLFAASATLALSAVVSNPAMAQSAASPASAAVAPMSTGEVRKVDKEAKKITLKHGEIKNLDMPAMTMVFQVKDPAMLDKFKPGDKVRFRASGEDGKYTLTELEAAR
jgi:Cu(I)/Ag(I) efflux system protein CusF